MGETTIRDFASDKIIIGDVKHTAKKWLNHDGYIQRLSIYDEVSLCHMLERIGHSPSLVAHSIRGQKSRMITS